MMFIRVWRSLVSRLTGGQEAAGSSPVTRTKKTAEIERFWRFFFTFQAPFVVLGIEKSGLSNTFV